VEKIIYIYPALWDLRDKNYVTMRGLSRPSESPRGVKFEKSEIPSINTAHKYFESNQASEFKKSKIFKKNKILQAFQSDHFPALVAGLFIPRIPISV
jgi:hypothetical protein